MKKSFNFFISVIFICAALPAFGMDRPRRAKMKDQKNLRKEVLIQEAYKAQHKVDHQRQLFTVDFVHCLYQNYKLTMHRGLSLDQISKLSHEKKEERYQLLMDRNKDLFRGLCDYNKTMYCLTNPKNYNQAIANLNIMASQHVITAFENNIDISEREKNIYSLQQSWRTLTAILLAIRQTIDKHSSPENKEQKKQSNNK